MDLNKEIRETIAFYCGGTYENRKLATDKILQICKDKPLPIHGVVSTLKSRKETKLTQLKKELIDWNNDIFYEQEEPKDYRLGKTIIESKIDLLQNL